MLRNAALVYINTKTLYVVYTLTMEMQIPENAHDYMKIPTTGSSYRSQPTRIYYIKKKKKKSCSKQSEFNTIVLNKSIKLTFNIPWIFLIFPKCYAYFFSQYSRWVEIQNTVKLCIQKHIGWKTPSRGHKCFISCGESVPKWTLEHDRIWFLFMPFSSGRWKLDIFNAPSTICTFFYFYVRNFVGGFVCVTLQHPVHYVLFSLILFNL